MRNFWQTLREILRSNKVEGQCVLFASLRHQPDNPPTSCHLVAHQTLGEPARTSELCNKVDFGWALKEGSFSKDDDQEHTMIDAKPGLKDVKCRCANMIGCVVCPATLLHRFLHISTSNYPRNPSHSIMVVPLFSPSLR